MASSVAETPTIRERVLVAATHTFASRGFDGTTLQAVADEVGVTKQAVLHHFPSKVELHRAVLDGMLAHWRDALPRLLRSATSEDRLRGVIEELDRFFVADPSRARLLVREMLDRPAELKTMMRDHVRPWVELIAGYISSGKEHGVHFPDVDAEPYILLMLELCILAATTAEVTLAALGGQHDRSRLRREMFRIARTSLFRNADDPNAQHDAKNVRR